MVKVYRISSFNHQSTTSGYKYVPTQFNKNYTEGTPNNVIVCRGLTVINAVVILGVVYLHVSISVVTVIKRNN